MASPNTGGYVQQFLDPPAKLKKFECPVCLLVIREPNLTSCCGQHFCQSCINTVITYGKPCPLCKEPSFSTFLDKKVKRTVLELKVSCSMKDRGCSWTGELREIDLHTDTGNGDCQFVEVTCPNKCGENLQRRLIDSHLSDICPKRLFTCKYCKFDSTYEVVCKHYDQCTKFPLPCPNKCEVESVERGKMKEHLSECPLQLVDCEFSHVGCSEKMNRRDVAKHMELNTQQHCIWAFMASQKRIGDLEIQVQKQTEAIQDVIQGTREKLEEKDREIALLQTRVATLEKATGVLLPLEFVCEGRQRYEESPVFYSHPRGAKLRLIIVATNPLPFWDRELVAEVRQYAGEFDDEIKWPVACTVTVHLLNQLGDHNHITGSKTVSLTKPQIWGHHTVYVGIVNSCRVEEFLRKKLEDCYSSSRNGVQYRMNGRLRFRVCVELSEH